MCLHSNHTSSPETFSRSPRQHSNCLAPKQDERRQSVFSRYIYLHDLWNSPNMFLWRFDQLSTSEVLANRETLSPILIQRQERVSQQLNKSCSSSSKNSGIIWQNAQNCWSSFLCLSGDPAGDRGDVPHVQRAQADSQHCRVYPEVRVRGNLELTLWENDFQNVTLNWKKYISTQWKSFYLYFFFFFVLEIKCTFSGIRFTVWMSVIVSRSAIK